jgi:hypothetical protein
MYNIAAGKIFEKGDLKYPMKSINRLNRMIF